MAFRGASTATYTFASGSTGSTVDLGANNNYRYINATNVYNKGKADGKSERDLVPQGYYYVYNNRPMIYNARTIGENSVGGTTIHLCQNISQIHYKSDGNFVLQGFNDDAVTDGAYLIIIK